MTAPHENREFDRDDDLRARLRAADPAASLRPADPDGVARLLEDTMSHDTDTQVPETRQTGTHGRSPLTWIVAAAATVVIAGVGIFALTGSDDDPTGPPVAGSGDPAPTITRLSVAPGAGEARCMVPTAEMLATKEVAFAGTVDAIDDGTVTLTPSTFYAGDVTDVVEVSAPEPELVSLIGAVDFRVGESYLVSASGGDVTVCGFSGPATPELQSLYDAAFGA